MEINLEKWNIEKEKILQEFPPILKEIPYKLEVIQIFLIQLSSFSSCWFHHAYFYDLKAQVDLANEAYKIEHYLKDLYQELTSEKIHDYFPERIFSFVRFFLDSKEGILFRFKQLDEFIHLVREMVAYGNKLVLDPSITTYEFDNGEFFTKFDSCLVAIDYFVWRYGKDFHKNGNYFSKEEDRGIDKWEESKKEQTDDE